MNLTPISRSVARAQGSKRYFTGAPCKHGHLVERRVANTKCVSCEALSNAAQRDAKPADPVKRAFDAKAWRAGNPEQAKASVSRWHREHPEERAEHRARWDAKNVGYRRANTARWRAAVRQATPPWLTDEHKRQIAEIYATRPDGWDVDHVIPLQGENVCGLHVPWNLQHLPAPVNAAKGNRIPA